MRRMMLATLCGASVLLADGSALFEKHCASCHDRFHSVETLTRNFMQEENKLLNLKAPALNQIRFRLKTRVGDPEGDPEFRQMEVVDFVSSYVFEPDRGKSICLPEVLKHFETMESLEGKVSAEDVETIANWIYESEDGE